MTVSSVFRRAFLAVDYVVSTAGTAVTALDYVEAPRRGAFGMRAGHPIVVGIHVTLATAPFPATVLRGTMAWAARQHLQLSTVRPG